ncbi:MAG TPA: hypothetical protein VLL52_17215 [Anaerolineae bacterium]|nr:hypothetical protein [Anaerolineae bacterium]
MRFLPWHRGTFCTVPAAKWVAAAAVAVPKRLVAAVGAVPKRLVVAAVAAPKRLAAVAVPNHAFPNNTTGAASSYPVLRHQQKGDRDVPIRVVVVGRNNRRGLEGRRNRCC